MSLRVLTPARPDASFRAEVMRVSRLEDRTVPATISTTGGPTINIDLDTFQEVLSFSTSSFDNIRIESDSGLVVNGFADDDGILRFSSFRIVNVTDSAADTDVVFTNSTTLYEANFSVVLDQDDRSETRFSGSSSFGVASLNVFARGGIDVAAGAAVTTGNGSLTLNGNLRADVSASLALDSSGVEIDGTVAVTGWGALAVFGRGGQGGGAGVDINPTGSVQGGSWATAVVGVGGDGTTAVGVRVQSGAKISATSGDLAVNGAGGRGTGVNSMGVFLNGGTIVASGAGKVDVVGSGGATGVENAGVRVRGSGSVITSSGGAVTVTGTGGTGSGFNTGVQVELGGVISAGGTADVTVTGTGGAGTGDGNRGVVVEDAGSAITSGGGNVLIGGTGGGIGNSDSNFGVQVVAGGWLTSGGNGKVEVRGNGSRSSSGSQNHGVVLNGAGAEITSSGGAVFVIGDPTLDDFGAVLVDGSVITAGSTAAVALFVDKVLVNSTRTVTSGGVLTVRPNADGRRIEIGADDSAGALGLTDAEFDRFLAPGVSVGGNITGSILISGPVTRPTNTIVRLGTSGNVTFQQNGFIDAGGGTLDVEAGAGLTPYNPGTDITAPAFAFTSSIGVAALDVSVSGAAPDAGHMRLAVNGTADLNGVVLSLRGPYVPQTGDVFILVSATTRLGTLAGLGDGAIIAFNGKLLRINYTPTNALMTAV